MMTLAERLQEIGERLNGAAQKAGRRPDEVELMAVSKTFPVEAVQEAVEAGQTLFGENRVQEVLSKIPALPGNLRWHLIGHLQSNKVRKILPHIEAIQSIDSLDLARHVNRIAGELQLTAKVYLEVNIGDEASKHGFAPAELQAQMEQLVELDRLTIQGLMGIPPFEPDPESTRPSFSALRELRDDLHVRSGLPLSGLSMGMSHDFEIAIQEGSTLVRVGSAIFGAR